MAPDGARMAGCLDGHDGGGHDQAGHLHHGLCAGLDDESAAVLVRRAYKEYRNKSLFRKTVSNMVIRGMDMTVRRGTIYGLLGASGCGKTTILKSIVGQDHLTAGEVLTLGRVPGAPRSGVPGASVGYMPQELALYIGFTIAETFRYFGWLTGVPAKELAVRTASLLKFLDLPPAHCRIGQLSGGQQRRVSFAVALLHQPPLLILDEPTVGVDPILRQRIWDHLMDITADGRTTVIITTHYIEEARQAHTLGLMRQGVLLAEDAPDRLLERYHCATMEEVFLKLSILQIRSSPDDPEEAEPAAEAHDTNQNNAYPELAAAPAPASAAALAEPAPPAEAFKQGSGNRNGGPRADGVLPLVTLAPPPPADKSAMSTSAGAAPGQHHRRPPVTWSTRMCCLLWKHVLWMRRNVGMVLFLILLPVVQCMLFGFTVGRNPKGLKLAVYNGEGGSCAGPDLHTLDTFNCSHPALLSCRFLQMFRDKDFDPISFGSLGDAKGAVLEGKAYAAVQFPDNFTESLFARIDEGQYATPWTLDGSEVSVWMDNSNSYITTLMQTDLTYGTVDLLQRTLGHCDYNPAVADIPVRFGHPIYGDDSKDFLDFASPGCALTLIFFMSLASAVGAILSEKNEGLLDRSLVMGVTMREIMWSHIVIQNFMMILQTIIVLVGFFVVLQITQDGPLFWVVLLCVLQGFCGMCCGMLVSALTDSDREATFVALGSFFPFIVLSGMIWPIEGMHYALRRCGWALPLTLATTSLRYMMTRGWGPSYPEVWYGFLSSIVWIVIFLGSALYVLRKRR
ncbi:ABC transporter G family member 20 [Frankliniella fusca]|uniref:ABC transporter G family member 20 n=1 Tax=Frankliniella fusca TaxID=407009 RepID=A0AAE1LJT0_9NEOP|nr:ABC transporter G family member 20 [Frankliniella fusca]